MGLPLCCGQCGSITSPFFIVVGDQALCVNCKNAKKPRESQPQQPRIFTRYICKTHKCGTYSANSMFLRHAIENVCEIEAEETLGVIKPATYGGVNGDIGRQHFQKQKEIFRLMANCENYLKFLELRKTMRDRRVRLSPAEIKKLRRDRYRYVAPANLR